MAKVKVSPIITDIRGKLDGVTFAGHYNQLIGRANMRREDANTIAQQQQRDYFISCKRLWNLAPACVRAGYGRNLYLTDATNYNIFIKVNAIKIKTDSPPILAQGGTLAAPTVLYSNRPTYGNITYVYWNPGDLTGTQRLIIAIIKRGTYGNTQKIETLELDSLSQNPQSIKGWSDADNANICAYKINNTSGTADLYGDQITCEQDGAEMTAPIGSISWWHKTLTGCPALPAEWAECNGQVLNDPDSPFDGLTLPDINNTSKRFIRGGLASGGLEAEGTKPNGLAVASESAHTHNEGSLGVDAHSSHGTHEHNRNPSGDTEYYLGTAGGIRTFPAGSYLISSAQKTGSAGVTEHDNHTITGTTGSGSAHTHSITSTDGETRPVNITMVAIIRIK